MDFDQMIAAHSKWKLRLKRCIDGQEKIDAQAAGKDDQCELGKWLYGDGKKHASLPAFADLKVKHAQFHKAAGDVVRAIPLSPKQKVLEMLEPFKGEFGRASSECINAIAKLKSSVSK